MTRTLCALVSLALTHAALGSGGVHDRVSHGYAEHDGVRIHYASLGTGPLVIMIHGFPDYWYSWRHQMAALEDRYQVVAVDQRGYNLSAAPAGVEHYDLGTLAGDIEAVIKHLGRSSAIIVGHDWGGAVAWTFAMSRPRMTERLIILNLPHPRGLSRELAGNRRQQRNSQYARDFQAPDAHEKLTAEGLALWVTDAAARERYVEAFRRSSFEAMLNYYKRNYPSSSPTPAGEDDAKSPEGSPASASTYPRVQCPVLMIHGLEDQYLLADGLNNTWDWLDADLTLVTIPGAGHFVHHDAEDLVTRSIKMWLER